MAFRAHPRRGESSVFTDRRCGRGVDPLDTPFVETAGQSLKVPNRRPFQSTFHDARGRFDTRTCTSLVTPSPDLRPSRNHHHPLRRGAEDLARQRRSVRSSGSEQGCKITEQLGLTQRFESPRSNGHRRRPLRGLPRLPTSAADRKRAHRALPLPRVHAGVVVCNDIDRCVNLSTNMINLRRIAPVAVVSDLLR